MNLDYTKPYFNMTLTACRSAGARGGRRSARSRRLLALPQPVVAAASHPEVELETAHEASLMLDAQFPHLRNAWPRRVRRPAA
jgi:hypothetical protein